MTPATAAASSPSALLGSATVDRKRFGDAIFRVSAAATSSGLAAVSNNVLLSADDGRLSLTTTDLDVYLETDVDAAEVAGSFEVAVNLKTLAALVRWASDPIRLEPADDGALRVCFGATEVELRGERDLEWPRTPTVVGHVLELTRDDADVIRRVATFASEDDARPVLTGVLLAGRSVVATDSYRLAVGDLSEVVPGDPALLPARVVRYLPSRLLASERIEFLIGKRHFAWTIDGLSVVANRLEGEFPNYEALLPKATVSSYLVDREALTTLEIVDALRPAKIAEPGILTLLMPVRVP